MYFSRKRKLTESQQIERKKKLREIGEKVYSIFIEDPDQYGFEVREGQQDMACEIIDAIINDQHLAVEAGVGIGKSYAYLIPLLLYSQAFDRQVVVATSTIALQEQLLNDVQHLQEMLSTDREVILAKGQTHYVCGKRADQYVADLEAPLSSEIKICIESGAQERKDFEFPIPQKIWDRINVSRFNRRNCFACKNKCLYHNIREKLQYVDGIVLCNQDFLTAHLQQRSRMQRGLLSEKVDLVVVDEAHNLEDKVRNATTVTISQGSIINKIRMAVNEVPSADRQYVQKGAVQAEEAVRAFYNQLTEQINQQINESTQDMKYAERFFFRDDERAPSLLTAMTDRLAGLSRDLAIQLSRTETATFNASVSDELDNTVADFSNLVKNMDDYLVWIERSGPRIDFVYCPKNTKRIIGNLYFNPDIRSILTSATLTTAGQGKMEEQYAYFVDSTGFPINENAVLSEPKPSPFPYDKHAMIYCCDDLPHPTRNHEEFIRQGTERLIDILNISYGKALILFTAKTDMEEVYDTLRSKGLPYKILVQRAGSSQESVLREFEENTDAVLLGTGAYWEGISIEGKSLSNLIVFRLPFPVPDPIIEYKTSVSNDPLMKVLVPEMVMKLKQGVGRLIRNFTDTGIISIIDPRLADTSSSPYRNTVWEALPIHNRTNNVQQLREFYLTL